MLRNLSPTVFSLLMLWPWPTSYAGSERDVIEHIFDGYAVTERPVVNKSTVVEVKVRLSINQIMDLNVVRQSLTAIYSQELNWYDQFLTWKPSDYGGVTRIRVPKSKLWLPDINVFQRINWADVQSLEQVLTNPIVQYNGQVTVQEPRYLTSACSVDVKYFPFDAHNCTINIGSWTYKPFEVDVKPGNFAAGTFSYMTNSEWELVSYQVQYHEGWEPMGNYTELEFSLHIRRRPWFMLLNTVLPTAFISCLTLINFFMPCETGEKMGYGITLFLALCVNLLAISSMLPHTGEELPIIQKFLVVCIMMVAFSLVSTTVVLRLYHTEPHHKIPSCIKRLMAHGIIRTMFCGGACRVLMSCLGFSDNARRTLSGNGGNFPSRPASRQNSFKYTRNSAGMLYMEPKYTSGVFCHRNDCNGMGTPGTAYKGLKTGPRALTPERVEKDLETFKENPYTAKDSSMPNGIYIIQANGNHSSKQLEATPTFERQMLNTNSLPRRKSQSNPVNNQNPKRSNSKSVHEKLNQLTGVENYNIKTNQNQNQPTAVNSSLVDVLERLRVSIDNLEASSRGPTKTDWMKLAEMIDKIMAITYIGIYSMTLMYLVLALRPAIYLP
ncbi:neuronal acetylcholine receptor subunit beta-4-like isoform X2 [Convolutriloba macropyga]|uniref:neuronal acetylcholine receptor subunit beta-4-like isoform X2 n=1 Tax=Convolutriloba macropyga TaxID=536237 RepID=UPI003F51F268